MSDWKNNPAITAIISGSIVLTTTLLVVFNYVIPVYQQADKNTIADLKLAKSQQENRHLKKEESLKTIIDENKTTQNNLILKIKFLEDELVKTKEASEKEISGHKDYLMKLSLARIFQPQKPLPIGFSNIVPGMGLDTVFNHYNKLQIIPGKSGRSLTVNVNAAGIGQISYYSSLESSVITHVYVNKYENLYTGTDEEKSLQSRIERLSLLDFLKENLGTPDNCGVNAYIWHTESTPYYTFYDNEVPDSYILYKNGTYMPGIDYQCRIKIRKLK